MVSFLKHFCFGLLLLTAAAGSAVAGTIPLASDVPEIDGKGDDTAWKNLPWFSDFVLLGENTRKPTAQTRFKTVHDGNTIYFFIEADEPQMKELRMERTERDSDIWNDDCVEIVIDPNCSQDRFYHFAVSAAAAVFDEERLQGGLVASARWNCRGMKCASTRSENKWTVEIAIPLVSLGMERTDGKIALNIARERYAGIARGAEISSFSPAKSKLLAPDDFAPFTLTGGNMKKFAWKLTGPYALRTVKRNGRVLLDGKIHLINNSGEMGRGFITFRINNGPVQRKTVIMDSGVSNEIILAVEADPTQKSALLDVQLTGMDRSILLQRQIPVNIDYSPMTVKLLDPPYRNTIFSDMKVKALTGLVQIHDETAGNKEVILTFSRKNGKVISSTRGAAGKFSLPLPELEDGEYNLHVQCGRYIREIPVFKRPAKKGMVRFDADKVMYVDGKPFFPYGWFNCRDLERAAGYGFNVVIEYAITAYKGDALVKYFDRLHALGMKGLIYCYPDSGMNSRAAQRLPLSQEEAEKIRQRVRSIKDHPALLGWYLCDEPDLSPALPERLKEIHDICATEDPYHPTVILNNTGEGYRKYAASGDIVMPDIYPNFMQNGNSGVPMITIYDSLQSCAASGNRILWCTPQGFNYGDCGHTGQRVPSPAELRNMHYQTFLGGATGFIWYIYEYNYPYPEVFTTLSDLLTESSKLPFAFAPGKRQMVKTGNPGVIAGRYDHDGNRWLIVVNTLYKETGFTLELPPGKYYAAGEAGKSFTSNGHLSDTLAPLAVRIYTTDRQTAESFSLQESLNKSQKAREYLRKKGNLAFGGDRKVDIKLDGFAKSVLPLHHLNDGAYYDGFAVTGKNPQITLTFPDEINASKLRLYGIDLSDGSGKVEILKDGRFVEAARLFRDQENPAATGEMSTFSDMPEIGYRRHRDALSAKWESCSFRTLRISGFRGRKIVEVEVYR